MNKEYKERLETLQGIDFCNCLKEYIEHNEKLEQENKELKEDIDKLTAESTEWEDRYYRLQDKWDVSIIELERENKELHNKIDKAIEYIKNKQVIDLDYLEKILKDSDVDE